MMNFLAHLIVGTIICIVAAVFVKFIAFPLAVWDVS